MRYILTACRPNNTKPVYRAGAGDKIEAELLIGNMQRFSGELHITIHDTWTGEVETKLAGRNAE